MLPPCVIEALIDARWATGRGFQPPPHGKGNRQRGPGGADPFDPPACYFGVSFAIPAANPFRWLLSMV